MTCPRLLVHCCCVHCSAYTLEYWQEQGYEVSAYWYNPNIHSFKEHQQRLQSLADYLEGMSIKLIKEPGYHPEEYFNAIGEVKVNRCFGCYSLRLHKAAEYAKNADYDAFTSSLLISPQQEHQTIVNQALGAVEPNGIRFKYADLRKKYSDSRRLTKQRSDLYRQKYCGCLFSAVAAENAVE